ncbi:MAG: metalloregulator ArsR/SmtB family transcription factor [Gammaproteobacteria bacterium]|nr:metalloregulator ArsR/SmtB family transcription factor [Gammaproteobacteria bacterium]MDH5344155.1 metalloregulator ArsR/SmtB family transcription factor [Gammaproteobacteria bacterium]
MVEYGALDDTFKALSDATRRAILNQLMSGPARIGELAAPYRISLNAVSKHVRVLEQAKLVKREVRGREHWIRFNETPLRDARTWADSMLKFRASGRTD